MGRGQILDMDVVAYPRAVRRGVVGAVDGDMWSLADSRFTGHLGQQGGLARGLTDPAARIGACDVEVTQGNVAHRMGEIGIPEHPFAHEFGAAVGVDRCSRRVLRGDATFGNAVDRSRR